MFVKESIFTVLSAHFWPCLPRMLVVLSHMYTYIYILYIIILYIQIVICIYVYIIYLFSIRKNTVNQIDVYAFYRDGWQFFRFQTERDTCYG